MEKASNYFIGVDFGTQGVRCGIVDDAGQVLTANEVSYSTQYPSPGWAAQDPAEWLLRFDEAMQQCIKDVDGNIRENIKGMTLCTTASTVLPVDKDGNHLYEALLWMDNRAKEEAEFINRQKHEVLKYCGGEVSVEWMMPKMLWLKNHRPDIYDSMYRFVELLDFMNHYLTGEWCSSICQATCKANYVQDFGEWVEDYYQGIGLDSGKLCKNVRKLGEPVGRLRRELTERYSLPADLTVYQGGTDAHVAMLGLGIYKPGMMGVVMGTSFVHLAFAEKFVSLNGIWGPYNDPVVPGLFCFEGGQVSAGSITKWFLREFGITGQNGYLDMTKEALNIQPGSDGVITLDYFQGNRTPYKDPKAKGVFYGLTLSHTKAHIFRSILEGVAFGTKNIIDTMNQADLGIECIVASGGVIKNPLWMKIIADVTQKPILLTKNSANAGILGCAILSAIGSGTHKSFEDAVGNMVEFTATVEPDMDEYKQYEEYYDKYLKIYQLLKPLMSS